MALAAVTFVALFFVTAPYGRFTRGGWGPRISARLGWVTMESPSLIGFLLICALSTRKSDRVALVFLAFWVAHYLHRAFIYPFRLRGNRPSMTLSVIAIGASFNVGNAYLNARYLFTLGPEASTSWLLDPRFLIGALLFWLGYVLNRHSDGVLIALRRNGATEYKIPYGGGYRFVSCPNYLGEMVEWGGWALACWNPGALAFFVWTVANLAPRAVKTHLWYRDRFPDYPPGRKALLPFII
ncbi:MAG: 3-oxo-5-alpha-steroid 4-dehydrogenase [Acidobacteria bacterium RBG_16_64_8]|nr:MAG: 3-oxo-5-alpha-steroid 4-dehydrogenase [Acidobacteria bacterium RBG_16_64_8]